MTAMPVPEGQRLTAVQTAMPVPEGQRLTADQPLFFHETASKLASHLVVSPGCNCGDVPCSAIKLNYLTT